MVSYGISYFDQCGLYNHSLNLFQRMKPCEFWGQLHKFSFVASIEVLGEVSKVSGRFILCDRVLSCHRQSVLSRVVDDKEKFHIITLSALKVNIKRNRWSLKFSLMCFCVNIWRSVTGINCKSRENRMWFGF